MRCISPAHAVMRCLSVCMCVCVCHVRECVKTNKDIFEIFSPSGSQDIIEFYALVNLKPQQLVIKKPRCRYVEADYRQTRSIARSLCDS